MIEVLAKMSFRRAISTRLQAFADVEREFYKTGRESIMDQVRDLDVVDGLRQRPDAWAGLTPHDKAPHEKWARDVLSLVQNTLVDRISREIARECRLLEFRAQAHIRIGAMKYQEGDAWGAMYSIALAQGMYESIAHLKSDVDTSSAWHFMVGCCEVIQAATNRLG